jgi:hypothetical protein
MSTEATNSTTERRLATIKVFLYTAGQSNQGLFEGLEAGQSNQCLFEGLEEKKFFLFAFPPSQQDNKVS